MVRRESGLTLIELLMVTAILGVMVLVAPPIMTNATKFFVLGRARLELQREARASMYLITRELRQAQSATIMIDQTAGQPNYSRISFTKETGGAGTSIIITQNNKNLTMTQGATTSILSKNLAYLAFTFPRSDDMTIVSVSLTLQEQIYSGAFKALHMASERVRVMN